MARLRVGQPLLRLRLFRAVPQMGDRPHQNRQGLRRRPERGGNPHEPRHADEARRRLALQKPQRRGEPRPLRAHDRRRVRGGQPRPSREDRHGEQEPQHARPRHLQNTQARASPHRSEMVRLPDVRLRARLRGRHRGRHALDMHARVPGPQAALRLVHRQRRRAARAASVRVRAPQPHIHRHEQAQAA